MESESERSLLTLPDPPGGDATTPASDSGIAEVTPASETVSSNGTEDEGSLMTEKRVMRKPDPDLDLVERARRVNTRPLTSSWGNTLLSSTAWSIT